MQIVSFLTAVLLATLISLSSAAQINWWDSSKSNEAIGLHGKDVKEWKAGDKGSDTRTERDVFSDSQLKRFDFGFQFGPSVVYKERYSAGLIFDCGAANISNMDARLATLLL